MHLHDFSVCLRALTVFVVVVAFRRCVFKAVMSIMNLYFLMNQRSLWCLNLSGRATASNRTAPFRIHRMDFSLANLRYYYDLIGSYTSLSTKITVWAVRLTIQVANRKIIQKSKHIIKIKKNESQKNTTKLKKYHKSQKTKSKNTTTAKKCHKSQKNTTRVKKYHKSQKLPQQCHKTQNIPQN